MRLRFGVLGLGGGLATLARAAALGLGCGGARCGLIAPPCGRSVVPLRSGAALRASARSAVRAGAVRAAAPVCRSFVVALRSVLALALARLTCAPSRIAASSLSPSAPPCVLAPSRPSVRSVRGYSPRAPSLRSSPFPPLRLGHRPQLRPTRPQPLLGPRPMAAPRRSWTPRAAVGRSSPPADAPRRGRRPLFGARGRRPLPLALWYAIWCALRYAERCTRKPLSIKHLEGSSYTSYNTPCHTKCCTHL